MSVRDRAGRTWSTCSTVAQTGTSFIHSQCTYAVRCGYGFIGSICRALWAYWNAYLLCGLPSPTPKQWTTAKRTIPFNVFFLSSLFNSVRWTDRAHTRTHRKWTLLIWRWLCERVFRLSCLQPTRQTMNINTDTDRPAARPATQWSKNIFCLIFAHTNISIHTSECVYSERLPAHTDTQVTYTQLRQRVRSTGLPRERKRKHIFFVVHQIVFRLLQSRLVFRQT